MLNAFNFKKYYGQNFVSDKNLIASIVNDANVDNNTTVVEVGTGAGSLTEELCKKAKKVISFEIDQELIIPLKEKFKNVSNLLIINDDALKTDDEKINNLAGGHFVLVANLPYYITTPLIFKFLNNPHCDKLTIMVQKEVAERIIAQPSCKEYGILSIKLNSCANCKINRIVSRNLFYPKPNVDSAIISITKKTTTHNKELFNKIVEQSFSMRRKTLQNNLTNNFLTKLEFKQVANILGLKPNIRGEALTIEDFIKISQTIEKIRQ